MVKNAKAARFVSSPWMQGTATAIGLFLVIAAFAYTAAMIAHRVLKETLDEDLKIVAILAAQRIDADQHARLTDISQLNDETYHAVVAPLREMTEAATQFRYIYTFRGTPEGPRFVVDSAHPGDADGDGTDDQAGLSELYENPDPEMLMALATGLPQVTARPYSDKWGTFVSAYAPVRRSDGSIECIVGVDTMVGDYMDRLHQVDRAMLLAGIIGLPISAGVGFCVFMLQRRRLAAMRALEESRAVAVTAQQRYQEISDRFAAAFDGTNEGLWDWSVTTGALWTSPRFWTLLGFDADATFPPPVLQSWSDRLHPDEAAVTLAALNRHVESGATYDVEYRMRTESGEFRWFRARGRSQRDASGRSIRMAGSIQDIHDRKLMEDALRQAARVDKLTGLPNRVLLLDRLQNAIERKKRQATKYAVLFLDFDRFKTINDSLGHEAGDQLLREIGNRLRTMTRSSDSVGVASLETAARLGGDEFVVLLDGLAQVEDATLVAQRVLQLFNRPFRVGPHEIVSSASIGIVTSDFNHDRAEDVLRDADTAMYEAKLAGKGRAVLFDSAMRTRVARRLEIENGLRLALTDNQFELHYQPIISLESHRMVGVEALLRWTHPRFGAVSPTEFIAIAEECNLIVQLGDWVFTEACRQLAAWRDALGSDAVPSISVNLSRAQLSLTNFAQHLSGIARSIGVEPSLIHLELTESAIMADAEKATTVLQALKNEGFKVDMDDFGTGYSSLSSLHQFPIDVLKIDRTFIANLSKGHDFLAMIGAITTLARNLHIEVIAEGIEDKDQIAALQTLDCQGGQGYYFARPMPASAIPAYLATQGSIQSCAA